MGMTMPSKSCADCEWFEADYEDASDGAWMSKPYMVCRARNGVSNLKQFPFRKTGCETFEGKNQSFSG